MGDTTASGSVHVAWADLSTRGAWILQNVEVPIVFGGAKYAELATTLGISNTRITALRKDLREEVRRNSSTA